MDPVQQAKLCPRSARCHCTQHPVNILCCTPCVYAKALTQATSPQNHEIRHPTTLIPSGCNEYLVVAGTCLLGGIVPCLVGVYIREFSNADNQKDDMCYSILAECCPLLSCAPCQIDAYRQQKNPRSKQIKV